ncbi:unnamed protein product, partial [Prorocentrum cordatum]
FAVRLPVRGLRALRRPHGRSIRHGGLTVRQVSPLRQPVRGDLPGGPLRLRAVLHRGQLDRRPLVPGPGAAGGRRRAQPSRECHPRLPHGRAQPVLHPARERHHGYGAARERRLAHDPAGPLRGQGARERRHLRPMPVGVGRPPDGRGARPVGARSGARDPVDTAAALGLLLRRPVEPLHRRRRGRVGLCRVRRA